MLFRRVLGFLCCHTPKNPVRTLYGCCKAVCVCHYQVYILAMDAAPILGRTGKLHLEPSWLRSNVHDVRTRDDPCTYISNETATPVNSYLKLVSVLVRRRVLQCWWKRVGGWDPYFFEFLVASTLKDPRTNEHPSACAKAEKNNY